EERAELALAQPPQALTAPGHSVVGRHTTNAQRPAVTVRYRPGMPPRGPNAEGEEIRLLFDVDGGELVPAQHRIAPRRHRWALRCPFAVGAAVNAARSSGCTQASASVWPPASRTAFPTGMAQRCSIRATTAIVPGGMASATDHVRSSPTKPRASTVAV